MKKIIILLTTGLICSILLVSSTGCIKNVKNGTEDSTSLVRTEKVVGVEVSSGATNKTEVNIIKSSTTNAGNNNKIGSENNFNVYIPDILSKKKKTTTIEVKKDSTTTTTTTTTTETSKPNIVVFVVLFLGGLGGVFLVIKFRRRKK